MSGLLEFRTLEMVEEEAAAWVWRLDGEETDPCTRAAFERWLRRDQRHRRAFEELGGVWQSLDTLAEAKRDEKVATFVAEERRLLASPGSGTRRWPRRWLGAGLAASLLAATGVFFWHQQEHESQTLSTAVGQHRSATLADGSTVDLNTNSIVETRFTRTERTLYLHKGEALFTVARQPDRPFVVIAGDTRVRAIGTAFNVRMHDEGVEVIVTHGRIEVVEGDDPSPGGAGSASAASVPVQVTSELAAGQRYQPSAPSPVDTLPTGAMRNLLAWREGAVVFDGVSLAQAIEELNRYTDTKLVIADPDIQDMRVGGRFRTGDVDGFVAGLTRAFPVTAQRSAENLIYIHAQGPAATVRH